MSAAFMASDTPARQCRSGSVSQERRVVDHRERRRECSQVVLLAERIDAVLDAHRRVVLRQDRRRDTNQPDAAMRGRCGIPRGIEHRAAADGDDIRMSAEASFVDRTVNGVDVALVVLDRLAAGHHQLRDPQYAEPCGGADRTRRCFRAAPDDDRPRPGRQRRRDPMASDRQIARRRRAGGGSKASSTPGCEVDRVLEVDADFLPDDIHVYVTANSRASDVARSPVASIRTL